MYNVAPRLIAKNPLFGSGWGFFSKFSGIGVYSHSNYVEILVSFGIMGFLLYYYIYFYTIKKLLTLQDKSKAILFITVIICLIVSYITMLSFLTMETNYIIIIWASIYLLEGKKEHDMEKNNNKI